MGGTLAGGLKARETNKARHGCNYYAELGRKGGSVKGRGGGFADRELASRAGRIGGLKSRRGKATKNDKLEDTWNNPNYRASSSTSSLRTRRHRCVNCKQLFKTEYLDDQGLCMTCPVTEPSKFQWLNKLRPF